MVLVTGLTPRSPAIQIQALTVANYLLYGVLSL